MPGDETKNLSNAPGISASEEMIKLLGLDQPAKDTDQPLSSTTSNAGTETTAHVPKAENTAPSSVPATSVSVEPLPLGMVNSIEKDYEELSPMHWLKSAGRTALSIIPYLLVFVIGVTAYYLIFADPSNRPQLFSNKSETVNPLTVKAEALTDLKTELKAEYEEYIKRYYFDISDASLLEPDRLAPNKLTNFENFLLGLNPRTNDIRNTGRVDAEFVLDGVNPDTGMPLKDTQKDIIAQYFDLSDIRSRVSLVGVPGLENGTIMPRGPQVQGYIPIIVDLRSLLATPQALAESSPVAPAPAPATSAPSVQQPKVASDTTKKVAPTTGPVGCEENKLGIDTNIPGRIEIPSIGVNVPIIWTKNPANFNKDLETGVVHYPCTPLPGDVGKSYISGHSSNYTWAGGSYNKVFARMNELQDGMTFKITVVDKNGKDIRLFYVVQSKQEYEADDQAQFLNSAYSEVALSTCWPINTTKRRLVTTARLDRIER